MTSEGGRRHKDDSTLLQYAYSAIDDMRNHMERQEIHLAFERLVMLGKQANEYIDKQAPWALRKTDEVRMHVVLHTLLETLRVIGIALQPLTPDAAAKMLDLLGIAGDARSFAHIDAKHALQTSHAVVEPYSIFPRIDG